MNIVMLPTNDLKLYEKNPRRINDKAIDSVMNSIREFGFKVPIVIDKNNVIVTGHTRLKAAKKLKMAEVPCLVADDLTDEQVKAFRIVDNRTNDYTSWDFPLLVTEIQDLKGMFDSILDLADFDGLLDEFEDITAETPEAIGLISENYGLTVIFVDEQTRDTAKAKIKEIEGCLDVRVKVKG
jgi:hypothetical protein